MALWIGAAHAATTSAEDGGAELLRFDLPVQPLEMSLAVFGRVTGYSVLVASSLTAGREAAAVQGDYAPRDALQQMLMGTGLAARYTATNAFTLVPLSAESAAEDAGSARSAKAQAEAVEALRIQAGYAAVLQSSITRVLCTVQPDTFGRYRLGIQLWIDPAGLVSGTRLLEGSGQGARDATVLASLRALELDAPPPPGMAQPITILRTPRADPGRAGGPYGVRAAG